MNNNQSNRRYGQRKRGSDALSWRRCGTEPFDMGWMIEQSTDGLAFAWRGDHALPLGTIIEFAPPDGFDAPNVCGNPGTAVVRHCARCHDDLQVVGVQFQRTTPFPPRADVIAEPHPERCSALEAAHRVWGEAAFSCTPRGDFRLYPILRGPGT